MTNNTGWIVASSFIISASGFLLGWWPLSVVGILILGLSGRWWFAVPIGMLFDLAYGTPLGALHYLYIPFTLVALVSIVVRSWSLKYVFSQSVQERL